MDARFLRNVLLKGLALFLVIDLLVAYVPASLGTLSFYNKILDGRLRFPFGEDSSKSYNLSLFNLDAMFAAHIISAGSKPEEEYRVIIIGDSSAWGTLLHPEDTLAGLLNSAGLTSCNGSEIRFFNLGYPTLSLTKDLMVLDYAMQYEPDLVIWPLTLESFPIDKQLTSPLVANNAPRVDQLTERYHLSYAPDDQALLRPNFWGKTLFGQRRALADLFRLQMYGVLWSATGIDQAYPVDYVRAQTDFNTDISFHSQAGPTLDRDQLAFEILGAGLRAAGKTPVLLINEPILISTGENSEMRYNFLYPRWAYDDWRAQMAEVSASEGWLYLDLWNLVQADQFTNSAIHLTPQGESLLVSRIIETIRQQTCP